MNNWNLHPHGKKVRTYGLRADNIRTGEERGRADIERTTVLSIQKQDVRKGERLSLRMVQQRYHTIQASPTKNSQ